MAVRMRLRPILMTLSPLFSAYYRWLSVTGPAVAAERSGYRGNGRNGLCNVAGIFFVPVFFVVIRRCFKG